MGDNVHIVAGFSKDFCISGLRAGYAFSHNEDLISGIESLGLCSSVSNQTQWTLINMLNDKVWTRKFLKENQLRLKTRFDALKSALEAIGVKVTVCKGTLMCWADFRHLLKENTPEGEF